MAGVLIRARLEYDRLDDVARELDWVADYWAYNLAEYQVIHHDQEAPLGREFYTDEQGHEHPGWLRDSVDSVPLPGPSPSYYVTVHADYGIFVNNGTRYIAPNPFWDRATLRTEAEAEELLERAVAQMFARVRL